MLFAVTGLLGCAVETSDGRVGAVKDFLFDDQSWKIRWMAVEAGHWLSGRRILIHPSAIDPLDLAHPARGGLPMMSGAETPVVFVKLTKRQIETGPDVREHEPVTRRLQARLHDHYGWDPYWGDTFFGFDAIDPIAKPILAETSETRERPPADMGADSDEDDPHLGSVVDVNGYHVHAIDGDIGRVENFLADDVNWDLRYLVIATHNWWPGKHVRLAPYAVKDIAWAGRRISVNVTRDQVKSSPSWDPLALADQVAEQQLHRHYGWPGYGW